MTRKQRLRRVVLVCCHFGRYLAYYRAASANEHKALLDVNFWRVVNGNFIDLCVLEWCKLFGETRGEHHWKRVVSNPQDFEEALLKHLKIALSDFKKEISTIRRYRDKFVAHLDSDEIADVPGLEIALRSVSFYHARIVHAESNEGDLAGLPLDFETGYIHEMDEANKVYVWSVQAHLSAIKRVGA
jgi:hypothetical protein